MVSGFTGAHKKTKIEICGKPRKRLTAVKVLAIMRLRIFINNIERMSRNKWSIEKAPLYKMACKTIMERIEGELCAK